MTKLQDETAAVLWLVKEAFAHVYSDNGTWMNVPEDAAADFRVALDAVDNLLGVVDVSRRKMVDEIIAETRALHDQLHAGDFETCPDRWCVSARKSRDYRAGLED